jgi:hypothetical protein
MARGSLLLSRQHDVRAGARLPRARTLDDHQCEDQQLAEAFRAGVASLPWIVQFALIVIVRRTWRNIGSTAPSTATLSSGASTRSTTAPKSMDWLAGSRMHFVEIILLRSITSLPLFTLGFLPVGDAGLYRLRICLVVAAPRQCRRQFQPARPLDRDAAVPPLASCDRARSVDKNFAIHFPLLDRIFGTYYFPNSKWPTGYGVPEAVPKGYLAQLKYPFVRKPG